MAEGLEAQLEVLTQENAFMKKYLSLRNKCEQLQQGNEKLVNRLHHVKKLVKRYKRERKFLQGRLDTHNDNYKDAQVPVMWEEDQMYNLLKPPPLSPPTKELPDPPVSATTTAAAATTKPKSAKKIKSLLKSQETAVTGQSSGRPSSSIMAPLQPMYLAHGMKHEHPSGKLTQIKMETDTPKRPTNAFLMFCDQYRQSVQNEFLRERNEIIQHHELTKRLALKWNGLSAEDKKVYYEMFDIEKRRLQLEAQSAASLESESALAAMQLESDAAVTSLLIKHEPS